LVLQNSRFISKLDDVELLHPVSETEARIMGPFGTLNLYRDVRNITFSDLSLKYKNDKKKVVLFKGIPTSDRKIGLSLHCQRYTLMIFIDLESTGLLVHKDCITEIGAVVRLWDSQKGGWNDDIWSDYKGRTEEYLGIKLPAYSSLIQPELGQADIEPRIIKLTGISTALIRKDGLDFDEVTKNLVNWLNGVRDYCPHKTSSWLVAHNGWWFDVPLLQSHEFRRAVKAGRLKQIMDRWWWSKGEEISEFKPVFNNNTVNMLADNTCKEMTTIRNPIKRADEEECQLTSDGTGVNILKRLKVDGILDTWRVCKRLKGWIKEELNQSNVLEEREIILEELHGTSLQALYQRTVHGERAPCHRAIADCIALIHVCDSLTFLTVFQSGAKVAVNASAVAIDSIILKKIPKKVADKYNNS